MLWVPLQLIALQLLMELTRFPKISEAKVSANDNRCGPQVTVVLNMC